MVAGFIGERGVAVCFFSVVAPSFAMARFAADGTPVATVVSAGGHVVADAIDAASEIMAAQSVGRKSASDSARSHASSYFITAICRI